MKNKKFFIIAGIILVIFVGLLLIIKSHNDKIDREETKVNSISDVKMEGIKDVDEKETPMLYDFVNSTLGMSTGIDFREYITSFIVAVKDENLTNNSGTVYIEGASCFENKPPVQTGVYSERYTGGNWAKIIEKLNMVPKEKQIKEKGYTFFIITYYDFPENYYQLGSINMLEIKFKDPLTNFEHTGIPLKYMKVYESYYKDFIDLNNPMWNKYNYNQVLTLVNSKDQKDIIKIRVLENFFRLTDSKEDVVRDYYDISEMNNYLATRGFVQIGG